VSSNFRLPSLHLGTTFDARITPLEVPGLLEKGSAPALCMLDGASRAPHRVSRLVRPMGLLGIKLADPGGGVRVRMRLLADDLSTQMWDRHMYRLQGEPMPEDDEYVPSDVSTRHRLIEVTAQGRTRALAVLALRANDDGIVRQHVSFEIGADEIGESGLVMLGLESPGHAPAWARAKELEHSLMGVCVAKVWIDRLDEPVSARVSTGRPGVEHTAIAAASPGFFALNPARDNGPTAVRLAARGAGGGRLLGRRAKAKHPLRFVRERYQDRRVDTSAPAVVEVVDALGETVLETKVPQKRDGLHEFVVPAGVGPVFVRARKLVGGRPRNVNWGVKARRAES
jgi:hypothetical protein